MSQLTDFVSVSKPREPYAHACKGKLVDVPVSKRTEAYKSFSLRSNAKWFDQTIDGKSVLVANTMFRPEDMRKLAEACEAEGVDRIEVAIFAPIENIPQAATTPVAAPTGAVTLG